MKSYLEVTWLMNWSICAGIWSLTLFLHNKKHHPLKISIYALGCTLLGWLVHHRGLCFLIRLLFSVLLYGRCLSGMMQSVFMMSVVVSFLNRLESFTMQNGLLYCDISSAYWIFVVLISFSMMWIRFDGSALKRKTELYVPVVLESEYDKIRCVGYLDTGNCMTHNGLPVVFVNRSVQCDTWLSVESVTGTSRLKAVLATAVIEKRKYDVMMAYAQNLQVECLLHVVMK